MAIALVRRISGVELRPSRRLLRKKTEMDKIAELYKNPPINAASTFLGPLRVALIVSPVPAGCLGRRKKCCCREVDAMADTGVGI
jgi:hypothetical protein